ERMLRIPTRLNAYGYDAWGFHPDSARRTMLFTALLYHYWFRVETHDIDRIPQGRVLLISNHAGQIALDAAMICAACFLEAAPPLARLLGMPAFPVTITFPWLGLLGLLPFPVKYRIYFGEPMRFTGNPSDEDEVIGEKVEQVKARIATMLADGLAARRSLFW